LIFLLPLAAGMWSPQQCTYNPGVVSVCKDSTGDFRSFANHLLNPEPVRNKSSPADPFASALSSSNNPFASFFEHIFTTVQEPQDKNNTWTLRLPIHARKVFFSQVQNHRLINPILLNESDFEQRRVFEKPKSEFAKPNPDSVCNFDHEQQHFILLLNITDQIAQNATHAWYVICAEFNAYEDGAAKDDGTTYNKNGNGSRKRDAVSNSSSSISNGGCTRCTLFKSSASTDDGPRRFMQQHLLKNQQLASDNSKKGNVLRYDVADMPFQSAKISGTVSDLSSSSSSSSNLTQFQFNRSIKPYQVVFINVPDDCGDAVKVDVLPEDEKGNNIFLEGMKLPLILADYLHDDS